MITTLTGIALLTAASFGGAVTETGVPASGPATAAAASSYYPPEGTSECAGREAVIPQSGTYHLVGDCPSVRVEASDVTLDVTGALVGDVAAAAARVDVHGRDISGVLSVGSDSNVVVQSAGSVNVYGTASFVRVHANAPFVTVRGDANIINLMGTIGSLTVPGNANRIEAGMVIEASDHGHNNSLYIRR